MIALPSGWLLFDTGIYIRFFRRENYGWLGEDVQVFRRTVLTAVVASKLYAGTRSRHEKRALHKLCLAHHALGHFSAPAVTTWIDGGIALRLGRDRFGRMDFAHHFRDVLIAQEAVRARATLVTENAGDFVRWKALLARMRTTLRIFKPS